MADPVSTVVGKGSSTLFGAIEQLPPGVQVALVVLCACAGAGAAVAYLSLRHSHRLTDRVLNELRSSSDTTMQHLDAWRSLREVVKGLEQALVAQTVELARMQSRLPSERSSRGGDGS